VCLLAPNQLNSPLEPFPLVAPSARGVSLRGIKFQSKFFFDPATVINDASCDPDPNGVAFVTTIWEALAVLPLAEGFQQGGAAPVPAYLPNFSDPNSQADDLADRLLWKRIMHIPFWGLNVGNGIFPQLIQSGPSEPAADAPIVVKSRAFLDDKHAVFLIREYVHDIAFGPPVAGVCEIPLFRDAWFKYWYRAVQ